MNKVIISLQQYQTIYHNFCAKLPGNQTTWIKELREQALADFLQTGFPTTRNEEWRYTSLRQVEQANIQLTENTSPPLLTEKNNALLQKASCQNQLEHLLEWVCINGQWLSSPTTNHSSTYSIQPLAELLNHQPECLVPLLNQTFDLAKHSNPFTTLNNALMQNGVVIQVPENQTAMIHLIFLTTPTATLQASHLRNLIMLGKNAKATIIESYVGDDTDNYLTNTVTEIQLKENATLTHYKFQNESKKAFHFGTVYVKQAEPNSQFASHVVSLGGLLSRSDTHTLLDAPMTHCLLNGLYNLSGNQHMDHHTSIHHLKPQGTSQEFYKGILDGNAHGVFNGKVLVYQDAQKTNSQQSNQNLLLSETAEIDTKPQLEILADDVRCVHGATVGQLDEESLFYLRSRGLEKLAARRILTEAFLYDVINRMPHPALREQVKQCL